jgi:hypothetical protein
MFVVLFLLCVGFFYHLCDKVIMWWNNASTTYDLCKTFILFLNYLSCFWFSLTILVFSPCDLNFKSMWKNECVKSKLKQEVTSCKPYLLSPNIWPSLYFLFLVFHVSPILTWILFFFTFLGFHLLDIHWKNKWSIRQGSRVVDPCHKKVLWNNCTWDGGKGFFL